MVADPLRRIGSPDLPGSSDRVSALFRFRHTCRFPSGKPAFDRCRPATRVVHSLWTESSCWPSTADRSHRAPRCDPLGAASKSVAAVAKAVVDYLQGGLGGPGAGLLSAGGGAAQYYGDSPEGPGRWVGAGAEFQRLHGTVQRGAFQRLLEGRHPHTGARLITARRSASALISPSGRPHVSTISADRSMTDATHPTRRARYPVSRGISRTPPDPGSPASGGAAGTAVGVWPSPFGRLFIVNDEVVGGLQRSCSTCVRTVEWCPTCRCRCGPRR